MSLGLIRYQAIAKWPELHRVEAHGWFFPQIRPNLCHGACHWGCVRGGVLLWRRQRAVAIRANVGGETPADATTEANQAVRRRCDAIRSQDSDRQLDDAHRGLSAIVPNEDAGGQTCEDQGEGSARVTSESHDT